MKKLTNNEFITKAEEIHDCKYSYEKVVYAKAREKVCITCPDHGDFWQTPNKHLSGQGCPECGGVQRIDTEIFIKRSRAVHGEQYSYTKLKIVNGKTKVCITCPEHGDFWQTPNNHLNHKQGCPLCSLMKQGDQRKLTLCDFIKKSLLIHGVKYDYTLTTYNGYDNKLKIMCPEHGEFWQTPTNHLYGKGCPSCSNFGPSNMEDELFTIVKRITPDAIQSDRTIINPLELDIVIPTVKVAIEFNGTYWHNDQQKTKFYHRDKRILCEKEGYRLISVWEIDWLNKREQVLRIIKNALGVNDDIKLNARDTKVVDVSVTDYRNFMNNNHIQGYAQAQIKKGLQHPEYGLIAVMSIKGNELVRYATSQSVRGGFSKLLKNITDTHGINKLFSFIDYDYFSGVGYEKTGFTKINESCSFHCWNRELGKHHRSKWMKVNIPGTLKAMCKNPDEFDIVNTTQNKMMDLTNTYRLWNSGTGKLVWRI